MRNEYYENTRPEEQVRLEEDVQARLEEELKEYEARTPMNDTERCALREWVASGHSVYENDVDAWYDGQVPVEFLAVFRDDEYIRQHTKGMTPDEARRFAMAYYNKY